MKVAYSLYCENHDQLQPLWIKYQGQLEAKQYLQRGLDVMREKTNCFDIPSVLIKPVQRILKYPLLLNELHKCTEDGHEDKPDLILAIDRIADMATHINEFKRRQDLVYKYRTESSHKLTSRLSKLNLHTVIKKGSRLGHRISSTLGLSNVTKDDEFNGVMQKFRAVEKTIKIFAKDKEAFMKSVEDFSKQGLIAVEAIAEYYDKRNKQQEVDQLRTTHRVMVQQYWQQFDSQVNTDVTPVLDKLMAKFSGPNKLIAKRFDKLTDYDSSSKKLECNKDTTRQRGLQEQQQLAKHVYEALNTQLIEELPQLCALSLQILDDCIQAFLLARKRLIGRIAKHHLALLELPLVLGFANGSSADITETFHIKHNLITEKLLAEISLLSTQTFPNVTTSLGFHSSQSDLRRQSTRSSRRSSQLSNVNISVAKTVGVNTNTNKNVNQSASQRMYLQARYQSHQLYVATAAYEAIDVLDIYLNVGDLVGVVKRQDPMGNSHRWYVDTGSAQGFVLSNILIVYHDDSWVTPPNAPEMSARPQTLYESPEKRALCFSENQKSLQSQYNSSPLNDSSNSGSSLAQHQYKVHPTPDFPVHLRHDIETHRYEEVNDSPPRYSRLDIPNSRDNSLLSFDESVDEKQRFQNKLDHSFDEFDPLYASNDPQLASTIASTDHRYEEVPEEKTSPPQRQWLSDTNLHFAAYPFKAVDTNQMSLEFGQPVAVLKDRDLNGNTQWWFVEDREGRTGYVPSNYLQKYQTK
ncbi:unnamed protein product [Medioppia subpectinata]|uniref:Dynamin-binding protein n=1 Tax=Medioppia subpectinata TaxID=1979941 RepID=A0A7R9Q1L7_9ACAR|nr:unnamed protein product [Medioppia subpectinata]CAG2108460.1 unnamed protein product [Medioppia subpectinata]